MEFAELARAAAEALSPYLPALLRAGEVLLEQAEERVADSVLDKGMAAAKGMYQRLTGRGQGARGQALAEAAQDVAAAPSDPDAQAALRLQLRKLFEADPALAAELAPRVVQLQQIQVDQSQHFQQLARPEPGAQVIQIAQLVVADPAALLRSLRQPLPAELHQSTTRYLRYLVEKHQQLQLLGMGITDRVPLGLPLLDLYVPLAARQKLPEGEAGAAGGRLAGRRPTAEEAEVMGAASAKKPLLELLQNHDGLVVLGDPGAGKSTFLKMLAVRISAGRCGELGLGERLPLLLPLAGYAEALRDEELPLADYFERYYRGFGLDEPHAAMVQEALSRGAALVLLDGLDEVKDAAARHLVCDRVKSFYCDHRGRGNKFVVTSRIVGYRDAPLSAEGLAECTVVDFEDEEIVAFIERWTAAIEKQAYGAGQVAQFEAEREKAELIEAVEHNPGVRELATNPFLLTILAVARRAGKHLPERRVELYDTCINVLLGDWQRARSLSGRKVEGVDPQTLLRVLAPVALWMQREVPEAGLVREGDLRRELQRLYAARGLEAAEAEAEAEGFIAAARLSNLLIDRGGRQFGFLHLTFQEYLAAVALVQSSQQSLDPLVEELGAHLGEGPWLEVSRLAIAHLAVVRGFDINAGQVLTRLLDEYSDPPGHAALLVGRTLLDVGVGGVPAAIREKGVNALLATLQARDGVPAPVRAEAGRVLAELGDPRRSVTTLDRMEFCWVPAGKFLMGSREGEPDSYASERPQHEVELAGYWLARFPVTVGQWQEYLEAGGVEVNSRSFQGSANAPVVWVSWHEALACCRWLTERWRDAGLLHEGWEVRLPSEAEWEKGARGGLEVPSRRLFASLGSLGDSELGGAAEANPWPGRVFPWVGEASGEHANYDASGINGPSAVGAFPLGVSPYGCEELSGNVWEWTRSLYGNGAGESSGAYRYLPLDGRENLEASDEVFRVLRGGSYFVVAGDVRCADRNWYLPLYRLNLIGFRLLLSPFSSDL